MQHFGEKNGLSHQINEVGHDKWGPIVLEQNLGLCTA